MNPCTNAGEDGKVFMAGIVILRGKLLQLKLQMAHAAGQVLFYRTDRQAQMTGDLRHCPAFQPVVGEYLLTDGRQLIQGRQQGLRKLAAIRGLLGSRHRRMILLGQILQGNR